MSAFERVPDCRVTTPLNKKATATIGKMKARNRFTLDGVPRYTSSQNLVKKTEMTVAPLKRKQETRLSETKSAFFKMRARREGREEEEGVEMVLKGGCGEMGRGGPSGSGLSEVRCCGLRMEDGS